MIQVSLVPSKATLVQHAANRTPTASKHVSSYGSSSSRLWILILLLISIITSLANASQQSTTSSIFQKQDFPNTIKSPPIECTNPIDPPFHLHQDDQTYNLSIDLPKISPKNLNVDVDYDLCIINILAWKFNPTPRRQYHDEEEMSMPLTPIECIYQEWKVATTDMDKNNDNATDEIDIYSLVMGLDQGRLTITIPKKKKNVDSPPSSSSSSKTLTMQSSSDEETTTRDAKEEDDTLKKEDEEESVSLVREIPPQTDARGNEGKNLRGDAVSAFTPYNSTSTKHHKSHAATSVTTTATSTTMNVKITPKKLLNHQHHPRASDALFFLRSSSSSSSLSSSPSPPNANQQLQKKLYEKFLQISLRDTDEEAYWLRKI